MAEIFTRRLVLRPFCESDLPAFVAYRSDPGVARYQSWDPSFSMADAEAFLASQHGLESGRPGAWVQLAVVDRETGAMLGDCASHVRTEPPQTAEIGVTLTSASQGRGVAGEALEGLVGTLFERHGIHRVIAQADDRNRPVHRLFDRLGFRCEATLLEADWFKGAWVTLRCYAVLEHEWAARRRGGSTLPHNHPGSPRDEG